MEAERSEGVAIRTSSAKEVARPINFADTQTAHGAILGQTAGLQATRQPPLTSRREAAVARVATRRALARAATDGVLAAPTAIVLLRAYIVLALALAVVLVFAGT